jgi:BlaI family transcriptional regulator, penicillinase repressor
MRPRPTESELAILNVLWQRGPSTVREVFEVLGQDKDIGYTTVLKLMQIMTEKHLVKRDESSRTHVYEAAYSQDVTQRQLVDDLLERAFSGSASRLVLQALSSQPTSKKELAEIRKLLDSLEKKK